MKAATSSCTQGGKELRCDRHAAIALINQHENGSTVAFAAVRNVNKGAAQGARTVGQNREVKRGHR
jgi:hypothetical protein